MHKLPALSSGLTLATVLFTAGCATSGTVPASPTTPQGDVTAPNTCAANQHPDDALVGKTEAEATALLQGCIWRLGEKDGQQFPGTMDYRQERRTIGVKEGKVTWVRRG
ncbi:hypothetical protein PTE30175_02359 [Pandoraea terrae]|uniref:Lipoprotein n=2 Tax=Pandoraea terrae TaxID=1537710 RepID=A0A5E4V3Q3_9BURK|nr:hypothetical protein [Pandoraea terrae]VVE06912.1 hypothetical protein PTE30175_02359 [Pandoraea terrae]